MKILAKTLIHFKASSLFLAMTKSLISIISIVVLYGCQNKSDYIK